MRHPRRIILITHEQLVAIRLATTSSFLPDRVIKGIYKALKTPVGKRLAMSIIERQEVRKRAQAKANKAKRK